MTRRAERSFLSRVLEALRDARRPATQKEAGSIVGIKQSSVSLWKNGAPRHHNVMKLAKELNVCVEWLYTERGPKRPPPSDTRAQELWTIWQKVEDIDRESILAYARGKADTGDPTPARDRQII